LATLVSMQVTLSMSVGQFSENHGFGCQVTQWTSHNGISAYRASLILMKKSIHFYIQYVIETERGSSYLFVKLTYEAQPRSVNHE